jgi:hypothetical protein
VDERAKRVGANEAAFRHANERVRELAEGFRDVANTVEFMCECGRADCVDRIRLTLEEYEGVRQEPTHFFLLEGHEDLEVEKVVTETDRYFVVEKLPGGPAGIAIREDPRD